MKTSVVLLLLLNIALFGWQHYQASVPYRDVVPVYAPPVGQTIYLQTERGLIDENLTTRPSEQKVALTLEDELSQLMAQVENETALESPATWCAKVVLDRDIDRQQFGRVLQAQQWRYRESRENVERLKFWLYIAAPASREEAQAIVADLKARQVDSYIISRGDMRNRISLGLYSNRETSVEEQRRIAGVTGRVVEVFEHTRTISVYVIEITDKMTDESWQKASGILDLEKMMLNLEKSAC